MLCRALANLQDFDEDGAGMRSRWTRPMEASIDGPLQQMKRQRRRCMTVRGAPQRLCGAPYQSRPVSDGEAPRELP